MCVCVCCDYASNDDIIERSDKIDKFCVCAWM